MNETKKNLGKGLELISISEPKFTTNTLMVMLLVPVCPERNSAYILAQQLLVASCRKYPDTASMAVRLDHLYGASINCSASVGGSVMQLFISGSIIANRYALEGEDLLSELTDLLLDCIFDPNVQDYDGETGFNAREFAIEKKDLLDDIQAEINNKRGYAVTRARRTAFEGEPDAYPVIGTREDVEVLTPQSVYQAYRELLRRAVVRAYYVGGEESPVFGEKLAAAFANVDNRTPEPLQFNAPSPLKPEVRRVEEPMDVAQSKLVLAFKAQGLSREQMSLFSAVYGGTPFSMLFSNVREKMSLCYYCASRVVAGKDTMLVDSGVELANAQRAHEAILEQLDAIRRGEFSDELLENTKQSVINAFRGIGDTPLSCISESYGRFVNEDDADPEERIRRYLALTREDMIAAANAMHEDTVYLMVQGGTAE